MSRIKDYNYFTELEHLSEYSYQCAEFLHQVLTEFDISTVEEKVKDIHEIEHTADIKKHDMMNHLAKEFITPIDREDIIQLSQHIDDVTDAVEDVLIKIHLFYVKEIKPEALEFMAIILKCCKALNSLLNEFRHFHKSKIIQDLLIEVNRLEEEGDELYFNAVKKLYRNYNNPVELFIWTELFSKFEKCCDKCEDAANVVEVIILKNS